MDQKNITRVYKMSFSTVYPLYIAKVSRKGYTKEDVDKILFWLTGHNESSLNDAIDNQIDLEHFFKNAPMMNPNRNLIKGVICGYRIEDIEDPIIREVRYMDKLIDELAKGKKMEKILRTPEKS